MYWIPMNAGSCSVSGSDNMKRPIQVLEYERRSQVNDVGRPAAMASLRRTVMRKWYDNCQIPYGRDDHSAIATSP